MRHSNKERRSPARAQERGGSRSSACGAGLLGSGLLEWGSRPAGEALRTHRPLSMQSLAAHSLGSLVCRIIRVPTADVPGVDREPPSCRP